MYWTDWQRRKLERKNIYLPDSSIELVTEQLSDLMGIRTVNMTVDSSGKFIIDLCSIESTLI